MPYKFESNAKYFMINGIQKEFNEVPMNVVGNNLRLYGFRKNTMGASFSDVDIPYTDVYLDGVVAPDTVTMRIWMKDNCFRLPLQEGMAGGFPTLAPGFPNLTMIFNGTEWQPTPVFETVILAGLNPYGVWYPLDYIGPTFGDESSENLSQVGYAGMGFYRVTKKGVLRNFKYTNASPSGSDFINVQLYKAPNGDPNQLTFTGVTLGILEGEHISTNSVDTLDVEVDDIIAVYNADPVIGYTPNMLTITAELFTQYY